MMVQMNFEANIHFATETDALCPCQQVQLCLGKELV